MNSVNSFDDGVKMLSDLCKQQLFPNGNKRTALCFANLCLMKKIFQLFKLPIMLNISIS
jgi:prophage maintenance system killer protein